MRLALAWVDVTPTVQDGANLEDDIAPVLSKPLSLLSVATRNTRGSWSVPFEIGIAFAEVPGVLWGNDVELDVSMRSDRTIPEATRGNPSRKPELER